MAFTLAQSAAMTLALTGLVNINKHGGSYQAKMLFRKTDCGQSVNIENLPLINHWLVQ